MIEVKNLHFRYRRSQAVFNGLSLHLQPGFIYGLLGKNGTGKSTLIRIIAGLLFPQQGQVRVLEQCPGRRDPGFLQQVFLLPEEFYMPNLKPAGIARYYGAFYPNFSNHDFERLVNGFEIPNDRPIQEMSLGQKKKTMIAFGLACNTPLLLMDEPTNGLDVMSKSQFRKIMAGAVDEDRCIVIATHQLKDVEHLVDRVTIIDEGAILFDHTMSDISARLYFDHNQGQYSNEDILFAEPGLRGETVIVRNRQGGQESRIDLELLYKAVVLKRERIAESFKPGVYESNI